MGQQLKTNLLLFALLVIPVVIFHFAAKKIRVGNWQINLFKMLRVDLVFTILVVIPPRFDAELANDNEPEEPCLPLFRRSPDCRTKFRN